MEQAAQPIPPESQNKLLDRLRVAFKYIPKAEHAPLLALTTEFERAEEAGDTGRADELREQFDQQLKTHGLTVYPQGCCMIVLSDDFYGNNAHELERIRQESCGILDWWLADDGLKTHWS